MPIVSFPEVSVCRLAGEQSAAPPELAGGAELDDELELPQPDAATAKATKATDQELVDHLGHLSKTWPRKRAQPTMDGCPARG